MTALFDALSDEPGEDLNLQIDRRRQAWRQVGAAQMSALHYHARLRRAVPIVAEMATIDPYLVRALGVLTAMMANFHLAAETLEALPRPSDLAEEVVAPQPSQDNADGEKQPP
jgi:hypothetical protein